MQRLLLIGICAAAILAVSAPGWAQQASAPTVRTTRVPTRGVTPKVLPGTPSSAFTTIQGNALNASNGVLPDSIVRLRDARLGRIVDTQMTDKSGLFTFRAVDPGSYVIELMGNNQTVLAASEILNVSAGDAVTAVVKLPFRLPPLAGLFGQSAASASAVIASAAATGLLATVSTADVIPSTPPVP